MRCWPDKARLLVIRLDASGDVLMCTPALHALRNAGFRLTLLTSPSGALVGSRVEDVDQVMIFDAPWMKAATSADTALTAMTATQMREQDFDGCVIFHTYSQSPLPAAMLCHLAGIPRQLAYCRENPYALLSDWIPEPEPESMLRHEVQRQLDLVSELGGFTNDTRLRLHVTASDLDAAQAALRGAGLRPDEAFVLLHPGATAASRQYALSSWTDMARQWLNSSSLPLVLIGGTAEQSLLNLLQRAIDHPSLRTVTDLSFGALAALIGEARVLIANNSAPAHLAAAMQTPVVVLYAGTNPQHTPWNVRSRVLSHPVPCAPCYRSRCPQLHHACMTGISPSQVIDAVRELLDEPICD